MHNLILTNMNIWDPISRLGDMKLMTLANWVTNEEIRAEEVKRVMKMEEREPLQIREEIISPRGIIRNNQMIFDDANVAL